MKNGPLIFLTGLIALVASWGGLVMAPVVQLGALTEYTDPNTGSAYPNNRPGSAKQGAEVYRSLGCAECHTRFATQDTLLFGARITKLTTNPEMKQKLVDVLTSIRHDWTDKQASDALAAEMPIQILAGGKQFPAERAVELIESLDTAVELTVHNSGHDLDRGWGKRQSVSRDYIRDTHALLGSIRIGPDLANIGVRVPDDFVGKWRFLAAETNAVARFEERRQWHLVHLYNPRVKVPASTMPGYRFLFEEVSGNDSRVADALQLPEAFIPDGGKAVVPTAAANALVAWLLDQQAQTSLPEAPVQKAYVAPKPKVEEVAADAAGQEVRE